MNKCEGCRNKAKFFIGSLKRELEGKPKWLDLCDSCEKEIADENAQVNIQASKANMTVAEYVEKNKEVKDDSQ